ncbi:MAG: hypothetical protein QW423_00345 [Candidatus Aenigmatarchaeota archaeon]
MGRDFLQKTINELFELWTSNLDTKRSRINIFEKIRDMPFEVMPNISLDYEKSIESILVYKKGSCTSKHFLLGELYKRLYIPIKYVTYVFYWYDLEVSYPIKLKKLASKLPEQYHLACIAYIEERNVLIDATWDLALKKVGFTVNEQWDGINDTLNSIKPIDMIVHDTPEERIDYLKAKIKNNTNPLISKFYCELNRWLNEIRSGK